jgi:hypothetical protein
MVKPMVIPPPLAAPAVCGGPFSASVCSCFFLFELSFVTFSSLKIRLKIIYLIFFSLF